MRNMIGCALGVMIVAGLGGCVSGDRGVSSDVLDVGPAPTRGAAQTATPDPFASPNPYDQPGDVSDQMVTPTPSQATQPAAVEPPPVVPSVRTHTIARGDTLYGLAVRYYGRGNDWPKIVQANPGIDPTRLPLGREIVIP